MTTLPLPARALSIALAALASTSPSQAQVKFIADAMAVSICVVNNWNTPPMQAWLATMTKQQRLQLYGSGRLDPVSAKCLVEKQPFPIDACDRVIEKGYGQRPGIPIIGGGQPFLGNDELDRVRAGGDRNACPFNERAVKDNSADDWLPADLRPSASAAATLRKAEAGDLVAQVAAAKLYTEGDDVMPDEAKAALWRRRAAEQGDVSMQYELAVSLLRRGQDAREGAVWMERAASAGSLVAQYELGDYLLMHGRGPNQRRAGIGWLERAHHGGHADAAYKIGAAYAEEQSSTFDRAQAIEWLRRGVERKDARAMTMLGDMIEAVDAGGAMALYRQAESLEPQSYEAAAGLTRYYPWGPRPASGPDVMAAQVAHAAQGDLDSRIAIALRYEIGRDVRQDTERALEEWRRIAEETGSAMAQRRVADLSGSAKESVRNPGAAAAWMRKAAAQGDPAAMAAVASDDLWHHAREADALAMLRKAAEAGNRHAVSQLNIYARRSKDVPASDQSHQAAQKGRQP